jgi:hypothetical protein
VAVGFGGAAWQTLKTIGITEFYRDRAPTLLQSRLRRVEVLTRMSIHGGLDVARAGRRRLTGVLEIKAAKGIWAFRDPSLLSPEALDRSRLTYTLTA